MERSDQPGNLRKYKLHPQSLRSVFRKDSSFLEENEMKIQVLTNDSSCYLVTDLISDGSFSKVARCVRMRRSPDVVVKILRQKGDYVKREIEMLELLNVLDIDEKNIVKFYEVFMHKGHTCITFEQLDRSLKQLLDDRKDKPLLLSEIRPITAQLLTAFDALRSIGIIHSDVKLENIMLVDHKNHPFKVKLIDFGVSFLTSETKNLHGLTIQPLGNRAPEVTLGLPVSEAIDMWGLACVLYYLYTSDHLFGGDDEYQMMYSIVDILGLPPEHLLSAGKHTLKFFYQQDNGFPAWRLMTSVEYWQESEKKTHKWVSSISSLDDLMTFHSNTPGSSEFQDAKAFVSLLKSLLHLDPEKRITPGKALRHPFITLSHMYKAKDSAYVRSSINKLRLSGVHHHDSVLKLRKLKRFLAWIVRLRPCWARTAAAYP